MFLRVAILLVYALTLSSYYFPMVSMLLIVTAMAVFVIQPYKKNIYNVADAVLLLTLAMWYLSISSYATQEYRYFIVSVILSFLLAIVPLVYITVVFIHWIHLNKVVQNIQKLAKSATCHCELQTDIYESNSETVSVFPDRLLNPRDYGCPVHVLQGMVASQMPKMD